MSQTPKAPSQSIAKDSAVDSIAQVGIAIISLLTGILLSRLLYAEGRGEYVFATAFAGQTLFILTNMGLELAGRVLVAKNPDRLGELHSLAGGAALVIGALVGAGLLLAEDWVRENVLPGIAMLDLFMLSAALPFMIYQFAAYGILIGLGKVRRRAIFDLIFNALQNFFVLSILVLYLFEVEFETIRWMVGVYYLLIIGASSTLFMMIRGFGGSLQRPKRGLAGEFYTYGFWVWLGNGGSYFNQRVDEYLVMRIGQSDALYGVYSLATSLTGRSRIFPEALTRSAWARICAAPTPEAAGIVAACFRQILAISIVVLCGGLAVSWLIPYIYGPQFAATVIPFLIFLFGRSFSNCSRILAIFFSGHLARPGIATAINWTILPFQAAAGWWAMTHHGIIGMAVVMACSYLSILLTFLILFLLMQKSVGLGQLLRITGEDWAPWKRMFGGIFRRVRKS